MEVIKSIKGNSVYRIMPVINTGMTAVMDSGCLCSSYLESVFEKKMLTRRLDETNIKIK